MENKKKIVLGVSALVILLVGVAIVLGISSPGIDQQGNISCNVSSPSNDGSNVQVNDGGSNEVVESEVKEVSKDSVKVVEKGSAEPPAKIDISNK